MADATIVAVRTIRSASRANNIWLEIETADGAVGLGETLSSPDAIDAQVHQVIAPYLLGQDGAAIERHWWSIYDNYPIAGIGVEARALSMVDIALWDLAGKRTGLPLSALFGGRVRDEIRIYNTCNGPDYYREPEVPGVSRLGEHRPERLYEDQWAFEHSPAELARDLLEMGIGGMKIWPFDPIADATGGLTISRRQLDAGLEPIRRIRDAVGDDIDIALELHNRWQETPAVRIAEAAEEYELMWHEDPVGIEDFAGLATVVGSTSTPVASGENLGSFFAYRALLEEAAPAVVIAEPVCVGGVTAMRRVAQLAEVHLRGFAGHDCGGPVNLAVDVHVALNARNAVIQEISRANYLTWYPEIAEGYPTIDGGVARPGAGAGHGVSLRPEFLARPDVTIREARLG